MDRCAPAIQFSHFPPTKCSWGNQDLSLEILALANLGCCHSIATVQKIMEDFIARCLEMLGNGKQYSV